MTHDEFVQTRLAFAIIDGNVIFQDNKNRKDSKAWLLEDIGLSENEYPITIRGGMFHDRITLSMGDSYDTVNLEYLSASALITILTRYDEVYGYPASIIYNGQYPDEIGTDWKARQIVRLR